MTETRGIVIKTHPGTLSNTDLGRLEFTAKLAARKSPEYASLLRDWVAVERVRREDESDAPIEPAMLKLNASWWSDAQLSDAATAAVICIFITEDATPAVRDVVKDLVLTINSWTTARLVRLGRMVSEHKE